MWLYNIIYVYQKEIPWRKNWNGEVLAALWMPTVLWANTAMSRWLPAMAISHSTLVLGMAHHAYRRLQRLQQPGARLVSVADSTETVIPPRAWLRLLWASALALNVTWTHLGALIYHYNPKVSPRSLRCFRGFLLTLGFCLGSWSLALDYVLSEWVFLRSGLRVSHFLYTEIAYVVDDSKMSTRTDSWTRNGNDGKWAIVQMAIASECPKFKGLQSLFLPSFTSPIRWLSLKPLQSRLTS